MKSLTDAQLDAAAMDYCAMAGFDPNELIECSFAGKEVKKGKYTRLKVVRNQIKMTDIAQVAIHNQRFAPPQQTSNQPQPTTHKEPTNEQHTKPTVGGYGGYFPQS